MAIKQTLEDIQNRLDALLTYANGVTGTADISIGDAIKTLADGYGGGLPEETGLTKMWLGTITITESTVAPDIRHGLGVVPKLVVVYLNADWGSDVVPLQQNQVVMTVAINPTQSTAEYLRTAFKIDNNGTSAIALRWANGYNGRVGVDENRIKFNVNSTSIYPAGASYNIIAFA